MTRWVKVPSAGQFRGEGEWKDFDQEMATYGNEKDAIEAQWNSLQQTGYLPTRESEEKPDDKTMGEKG